MRLTYSCMRWAVWPSGLQAAGLSGLQVALYPFEVNVAVIGR
jgi:hypothetical protein